MNPTPSQLAEHRLHKQRLGRIAARALNSPLTMVPETALLDPLIVQPDVLALPLADLSPVPEGAIRVRWFDEERLSVEKVKRAVAAEFGVTRRDLDSSRRTRDVVLPRQLAMYLAKKLTLRSLPDIGRRFGGRDHTTVLHAVRKIESKVTSDVEFAARVAGLTEIINA